MELEQVVELLETDSQFREAWLRDAPRVLSERGFSLESPDASTWQQLLHRLVDVRRALQHSFFGA